MCTKPSISGFPWLLAHLLSQQLHGVGVVPVLQVIIEAQGGELTWPR